MLKYSAMYTFSELNLVEVLTEKGEKMQVFSKCIAIQAKILEATLREKDF